MIVNVNGTTYWKAMIQLRNLLQVSVIPNVIPNVIPKVSVIPNV